MASPLNNILARRQGTRPPEQDPDEAVPRRGPAGNYLGLPPRARQTAMNTPGTGGGAPVGVGQSATPPESDLASTAMAPPASTPDVTTGPGMGGLSLGTPSLRPPGTGMSMPWSPGQPNSVAEPQQSNSPTPSADPFASGSQAVGGTAAVAAESPSTPILPRIGANFPSPLSPVSPVGAAMPQSQFASGPSYQTQTPSSTPQSPMTPLPGAAQGPQQLQQSPGMLQNLLQLLAMKQGQQNLSPVTPLPR